MRRFVVLTLMISLCNASMAVAGESLLAVASRVTREVERKADRKDEPRTPKSPVPTSAQKSWTTALAQEQPAMSNSGLRKRTKILIYVGAALGFAATAYAIDQRVEDNTPSSHGLRED